MGQARAKHGIDIRYVADLVRIEITDEEAERYGRQLDDILAYVNQLQELDIEGIEPTAHAVPVQNVMREDRIEPSMDRREMLANAPAGVDDAFIRVPAVLDEEEGG